MLIKITNKCFFECYHCFQNSNSEGEHMKEQIFEDVLKFIYKYKPKLILISGGEPTIHPKFKEWIYRILNMQTSNYKFMIAIISNGWFILENGDIPEQFKFNNPFIQMFINNDSRFYSKKINAIHGHKDYTFNENKIKNISKCIKLKNNKNLTLSKNIHCGNIRINTIIRRIQTFKELIDFLEKIPKSCVPLINEKGNIMIGESDICQCVGTIYDSSETLMKNIYFSKCDNCGNYFNEIQKITLNYFTK